MQQTITFITTSFGRIHIKVIFDKTFVNSINVGKARLHLDAIIPKGINIEKENFHINIYDGVHTDVELILNDTVYYGEFLLYGNHLDNSIWVEKPSTLTMLKQS